MMNQNASVNFYMFYGGTNFGFTAGANNGGPGGYNADLTSYDYDAPINESGDPTSKYFALREVIGEYLPLPDIPLPVAQPKLELGPVAMRPIAGLLSTRGRAALGINVEPTDLPLSFEALNQYSGFVLYETRLPELKIDPSLLVVKNLHDRAQVLVDGQLVGTISRESQIDRLPIMAGGSILQIFVENQGRINYAVMEDFKGILGNVMLNGHLLGNWTHTGYPLKYDQLEELIRECSEELSIEMIANSQTGRKILTGGPASFIGVFEIDAGLAIHDTFLDPTGWGKVSVYSLFYFWYFPNCCFIAHFRVLPSSMDSIWDATGHWLDLRSRYTYPKKFFIMDATI